VSKYLVADPPPTPPLPPDDRPRRRPGPPPGGESSGGGWRTILPYVAGVLMIAIGCVFGVIAYRMLHDGDDFQQSISKTLPFYVPAPASIFGKDRIYVLLLGLDYDYTITDQPFSAHSRTDTIKVLGIDFPSKSIKLVSVLRDTGVELNGRRMKINEAYVDGGEKLSDQVIGDFIGLPPQANGNYFDRYIIVNSNGLKEFVDAIGGIDVPVTEQMDYDDSWGHLHIHFKPGLVHMNGTDAMGYSRFRHDACSDPCRTKRQDQVIHIAIAKLKSQKLNDLLHIGQILGVLNRNVKTNLTFDEEKSMAWAFKDANLADLTHSDTIGYSDAIETSAGELLIPDEAQKTRIVADLLGAYGNVTPAPVAALSSIKPSTIHVVVENGSGISGLAGTAAQRLKSAGYIVDSIANADAFSYDVTEIRPASKVPLVGERVRADLGVPAALVSPSTDATPGPRAIVTVIVGKDFAQAQVTAPAASGAPSTSASPSAH
jgi:LCP family protein required for cell wall assembly